MGSVSKVPFRTAGRRCASRRGSYRAPFRRVRLSRSVRARLLAANRTDGVGLRVVSDVDSEAVAKGLCHSALMHQSDRSYQRELSAWTAPRRDPLPGEGVSAATRRVATLPWAGLVRANTAVPDVTRLTRRLRDEYLVLVQAPDDGPIDHVRAGMAAESVWLAAVAVGLVCSLLTQPFHLHESRAGLVESLRLTGFPQLLLRLGHPNQHREDRR